MTYYGRQGRPLLTQKETTLLRRIAQGDGIIVTMRGGQKYYSSRNGGFAPPQATIERLIKAGALIGDERGLFDEPQSYRCRLPSDGLR